MLHNESFVTVIVRCSPWLLALCAACSAAEPVYRGSRASSIALGGDHACRITRDGGVECWGGNARGQLGDGTRLDRGSPVPVVGLTDVVRLAASTGRTCAVRGSGEVLCWGRRSWGFDLERLQWDRLVPEPIEGIDDAVDVSSSDDRGCALRRQGRLTCWLEPGSYTPGERSEDHFGDGPRIADAVGLAVADRACVLRGSGEVSCFSLAMSYESSDEGTMEFEPIELGGLHDVARLSVWGSAACAVQRDGTVWCWGSWRFDPELGGSLEPERVAGLDDAVDVAVGDGHACVLHGSGAVSCWGLGRSGALGQGAPESSAAPVRVEGLSDAVSIGVGGLGDAGHSCAVRRSGETLCWGWDGRGQLGRGGESGQSRPRVVGGLSDVVQIGAGSEHTCALTGSGQLRCWGGDSEGQLGTGERRHSSTPAAPALPGEVALVEASERGTCAVLRTGEIACWGRTGLGALGLDDEEVDLSRPRLLPGIVGVRSVSVAEDVERVPGGCLVRDSGSVECLTDFRYPFHGEELEDGRVVIPDIDDAVEVTYGATGQCFVAETGEIGCWEDHGTVPLRAGDSAVSAGFSVLCLVRGDGAVLCIGDGSFGQTGTADGAPTNYGDDATEVVGLDDAVDVDAGEGPLVCALREGGTVACWGWALTGVFGALGPTLSAGPTEIEALDDVVQVAVGGQHVCALDGAGEVSCWGSDELGQLGTGRSLFSAAPVRVE